MRTQATKQHSSVEMAEIAKLIFKEHGGNLADVIIGLHLEMADRAAALESRVRELEAKKR